MNGSSRPDYATYSDYFHWERVTQVPMEAARRLPR